MSTTISQFVCTCGGCFIPTSTTPQVATPANIQLITFEEFPDLIYYAEEASDPFVQSEADRLLSRLLPKKIGLFEFHWGEIGIFDLDGKFQVMERDNIKYEEARLAVRALVAKKVDHVIVAKAEQILFQYDVYMRFLATINVILKNPLQSAGIRIIPAPIATSFLRGQKETSTMILYDYLEYASYAKVKFGNADSSINSEPFIVACDGLTFLQLVRKKLRVLMLDVVELLNGMLAP
ncbi:MAG: hypothetical protein Edafosvirus1_83 [Edafosvirus sp.]|uniref:Uncharacterized protein n=1 Tax=Edafosvirus sp. TaxID=2487765 RepID=A0A3G4ZS65_9VIRU|nr:MAG: hypothetical protein Edafosvirus1_83 [Edafosvirus sp.]